jgi:hypothetical protein
MDQLSAFRVPKRRLRHIHFHHMRVPLQLELYCLPIFLKMAVTVTGSQLDAISGASGGTISVFPGGYDHVDYLVSSDDWASILKNSHPGKIIFPFLSKLETSLDLTGLYEGRAEEVVNSSGTMPSSSFALLRTPRFPFPGEAWHRPCAF